MSMAEPTVDETRDASGAVQSGPMETEAAPGHTGGEYRGGEEGQGTSCHLHAAGEAQLRSSKAGLALACTGPASPDYARPCDTLPGLSDLAEPGVIPGHLEPGESMSCSENSGGEEWPKKKALAFVPADSEGRHGGAGAHQEDYCGVPFSPASPRKRKLFQGEDISGRGGEVEGRMVGAGAGVGTGQEEGSGAGPGGEAEGALLSPVLSHVAPPSGDAALRPAASPEPPRDSSPEPACHSPQGSLSCCGSTGSALGATLGFVTPQRARSEGQEVSAACPGAPRKRKSNINRASSSGNLRRIMRPLFLD